MTTKTITEADFQKFKEYFYRKTGIMFEDSRRYFVDKRIIERIEQTNTDNFRNYFTFLRFQASGEEMQALINSMTVKETYFFREEYQFKSLVESVLPAIVAKKAPGSTIRIWSIPSSSGEEPYSIALYLTEYWQGIHKWDVEIIASDIDTDMVRRCKQGRYSIRSVQNLPPKILQRHFRRLPDGDWQISDDLRSVVDFTRVNLSDPAETRPYRNFDVVFCRNLLIYFDDISRRQAAEVFYDALNPGGFIFLGHSESMSRITSLFKVCQFSKENVYRKPEV